jgi:hypothetical protein
MAVSSDNNQGEVAAHRGTAQDGATPHRSAAGGAPGTLESSGLLKPAAEQGHCRRRNHGEPEQPLPAQGVSHPSYHGNEAGSGPPPGRNQRDGFGPIAAEGLLGRDYATDRAGARKQRPTEGEQCHEPPVAGAERRNGGDCQSKGCATQHDPPAAKAIGQPGQGQAAQGGQPDDPEANPQDGERQADLGGDRRRTR